MPDTYLTDIMKRVAAMEVEALATLSSNAGIAVRYWPYTQDHHPYMTNRLGAMTVSGGGTGGGLYSEDNDEYLHTVLMRLVVGHLTEGYAGDIQDTTYDYIDAIEEYFREHPMLNTDAGSYTTPPSYIGEARMTGHTGLVAFIQGNIGQTEIGVEFTLLIPVLRQVY